jgi:hypothetical protein
MAKRKSETDPVKRIMGTHTGATVLPDGRIELAPMHRDLWMRLLEEEAALNQLLISTQRHYIDGTRQVLRRRGEWWDRVFTDLFAKSGEEGWKFDGRYLTPPPPVPVQAEKAVDEVTPPAAETQP